VIRRRALQMIGRRSGQPLLHQEVIHQLRLADTLQVRQARPVPQHVTHSDVRLAVRAELRPVLGHRFVVRQQFAVDEAVNDG
jgi:hypothetical protein